MNEEKSFLDMPVDTEPFEVITDEEETEQEEQQPEAEQEVPEQEVEAEAPEGDPEETQAVESTDESSDNQEPEEEKEDYNKIFNKGFAKASAKKDAEIEALRRQLEQSQKFIDEQKTAISNVHTEISKDELIDENLVKQAEQAAQQQFVAQPTWNVGAHDINQQSIINQRAILRAQKVFGDEFDYKAGKFDLDVRSGLLPQDTLLAVESLSNPDEALTALVDDDGFKAQVALLASQSRGDYNNFQLKFNELASKLNVESEVKPVIKPKVTPNEQVRSKPVTTDTKDSDVFYAEF